MIHPINIDSILETKASGSLDVSYDLQQIEGKSIAELLYDQENNKDKDEQNQST
jgi:hypothetical protein